MRTVFTSTRTRWHGKEVEDAYVYAYRAMISTGLRPGELLALERTSMRNGRLRVSRSYNDENELTTGKNENAKRSFLLTPYASAALEAQLDQLNRSGSTSPLLFPSPKGGLMSQELLRKMWYRYCDCNGINKITPYELRHTFVSINKDMPGALKKMLVGHSKDMDTDGIYDHKMAGDQQLALQYAERAFQRVLNGDL